jgi:hypothetical protein
MLCDRSQPGCMQKLERGMLERQSFLGGSDQQQGKVGSERYDGLKNLFRRRMLIRFDLGLGSSISYVFKLRF